MPAPKKLKEIAQGKVKALIEKSKDNIGDRTIWDMIAQLPGGKEVNKSKYRTYVNYITGRGDFSRADASTVVAFCDFFNCDEKYLIDEKETTTNAMDAGISELTGLSEKAVKTLLERQKADAKNPNHIMMMKTLDLLIELQPVLLTMAYYFCVKWDGFVIEKDGEKIKSDYVQPLTGSVDIEDALSKIDTDGKKHLLFSPVIKPKMIPAAYLTDIMTMLPKCREIMLMKKEES